MNYSTLVKHAQSAKKNSYSPYSRFRVGAALLTPSGKVIKGCNIENSSYGLTICAERTAIFKAASDGYKKFKAIAIATDENAFTEPCGACRQVLMDLAGDIDFIMSKPNGDMRIVKMSQLLPFPFSSKNLLKPPKASLAKGGKKKK
jgi:cytidine deaminase